MTPAEIDALKIGIRRMHKAMTELWLEKVLLRNLIIDSGWKSERDLEAAIDSGKRHPQNIRQVQEHFAADEEALARIGLSDWLAWFDKHYPRID